MNIHKSGRAIVQSVDGTPGGNLASKRKQTSRDSHAPKHGKRALKIGRNDRNDAKTTRGKKFRWIAGWIQNIEPEITAETFHNSYVCDHSGSPCVWLYSVRKLSWIANTQHL
jgi:hypothetical protein